jgi:hypothetical protein
VCRCNDLDILSPLTNDTYHTHCTAGVPTSAYYFL